MLLALILRSCGPTEGECANNAVDCLYHCAVAQAVYSLHDWQGDGVHRFATSIRDLYYREVNGKPMALVPRRFADADSPSTAWKGYYFVTLARDKDGPIDPCLDFAIGAVPTSTDWDRLLYRASYHGAVYIESERARASREGTAAALEFTVCPDVLDEEWAVIGWEGFVRIESASVATIASLQPMRGRALTLQNLDEFYEALYESIHYRWPRR